MKPKECGRIFFKALRAWFWILPSALSVIGCSGSASEEKPIKIEAVSALNVKLGDEIKWEFKASRSGRKVKIVEITGYPLPFGVRKSSSSDEMFLGGKVLGRQFRSGRISVRAFDLEGCQHDVKKNTYLSVKNSMDAGIKDITLPVSGCLQPNGSGLPEVVSNTGVANFEWRMADGPDDLEKIDVKEFLMRLAGSLDPSEPSHLNPLKSQGGLRSSRAFSTDRRMNAMNIPHKIAPGSFDLNLGPCAVLTRPRCGEKASQCLWALESCLTASVTGRSAEGEQKK